MSQKKELISILNILENQCETFYKQLDVEVDKAAHHFHKNPKHFDLLMTNLKVDLEKTLEPLKQHTPTFYQKIKGDLSSYEKAAFRLIDYYKKTPFELDPSQTLDFIKTLEDKKQELRALLDQVFLTIRNEFPL